jgi:hypothetical protein
MPGAGRIDLDPASFGEGGRVASFEGPASTSALEGPPPAKMSPNRFEARVSDVLEEEDDGVGPSVLHPNPIEMTRTSESAAYRVARRGWNTTALCRLEERAVRTDVSVDLPRDRPGDVDAT